MQARINAPAAAVACCRTISCNPLCCRTQQHVNFPDLIMRCMVSQQTAVIHLMLPCRANKGKPGIAKAAPAQALQSQQAPAQQQPVRGKAAKTKKLKHYEDQDEDDRQLAMQLLASAGELA